MIWLSVDGVRFKFKFKTTTIETRVKYLDSMVSGELHLSDFKLLNEDDSSATSLINSDSELTLVINNVEIDLLRPQIIFHDDWCVIVCKFDNILNVHETILNSIKTDMIQSLKCFNIFPGCNLRCPYCSQGIDQHSRYEDDYNLYKGLIKYDHNLSLKLFEDINVRYMDRIMGDETLLDWDMFRLRLGNIINDGVCYKDAFETYTNGTIPENVEKLLNWILTEGIKTFNRFEVLITVDTLDHTTSLRYNKADVFEKYRKTLKILQKYNHYNFINIFFNVMYKDHDTFLNTVKELSEMGFKYYKPGFNERDGSDEYVNNYSRSSSALYNECSKYMNLVKTRNRNDLVYCFYIFEFDKMVYEHKYTFDVGYNAVQYFQSHKTREDGDSSEIWHRFTIDKNLQK